MTRFNTLTTSGTNPASGTTFVSSGTGTNPDILYTIDEIAGTVGTFNGFGKILATANIQVFVNPSTGSDSNPGTSGSPFQTIGRAVKEVLKYDYVGLWNPVITLANGTYSNTQLQLPPLLNPNSNGAIIVGNNATPTSCTIADAGTNWTFEVLPYSNWGMSGIDFSGTFGGILQDAFSVLNFEGQTINFSGSLANGGIQTGGTLNGFGSTITTTTSGMGTLIFSGGVTDLDHATIKFVNAVTFTGPLISCDSRNSFFAFDNGTMTNASNVTISAGQTALAMTNGSFFETNPSTKVDGSLMTRSTFPAGLTAGCGIDAQSTFQPDNGIITTAGAELGWSSGVSGAGVVDTGISRSTFGAGIVAVGNGTANDFTGIVLAKNFLSGPGGTSGYAGPGLGVGGTVTQATSKSTAVTLNNSCGAITMNNAALAAGASVSFTFTNSTIQASDIILNTVSGAADPTAYAVAINAGAGTATVHVRNISAGSLSEAIVITFGRFFTVAS